MIQSMTGFAEKRFNSPNLEAKISIKTLNHRFFDWYYRGPQLGVVENRLRAISQKKIHRGRVEVSVELNFLNSSGWDVRLNEDLIEKVVLSLEKMLTKQKREINFSLENILAIPHAVDIKKKDFTQEEVSFLERIFEKTLDEVIKARKKEGRQLRMEIINYVHEIKKVLRRVAKLAKDQPLHIKNRLIQRVKELSYEAPLSEEKLLEEAVYFAQRYDLSEEVLRLNCHLNYMQELLSSKVKEPVGRKLDFLAQELVREANTINSKTQDIRITQEILTVKNQVENIRQQVQNIE